MIRLEVAVAAPLWQTLTYLSPEQDPFPAGDIIGKRVLVPLGGRRVTGYVVGILPDEDVGYVIRPVGKVLDRQPLFHANAVPFFRWIASYYHYPIGEVIKTALPAGLTTRSVKRLLVTDRGGSELRGWFSGASPEPLWVADLLAKGSLSASASKKITGDKHQNKILATLLQQGLVSMTDELLHDGIKEKEEVCYTVCPGLEFPADYGDSDLEVEGGVARCLQEKHRVVLKKSELKALYSLGILGNISGNRLIPQRELLRRYPGAAAAMPALLAKGLVSRTVTRVFRDPCGGQLAHFFRPEILTEEQTQTLAAISAALLAQRYRCFLLHGVTGSGKTEVYLQAAEKTLQAGRDVLVLVPEIALATQLESHFVSRFGAQVVLQHSGLSTGERFDQWCLAASGQARIVIGARSAVFAPLANPGLIVVDEEHDPGYKQDDSLRYHGRDLAIVRARTHNAVVVLGSATPSVTSYYNAMTGKYALLKMTGRVSGHALPEVAIIDLRKKNPPGTKGILRPELREALALNLARQEQSLLLLNRRGFSTNMLCQECGSSVECLHCHVSLVYHKKQQRLVCHYCGYTLTHRLVCATCRSEALVPMGFGVERIEEEVRALFPEARVARLDSDTTGERKKFLQVLKAMHNREIDILVGTQMIAKGHHFPHVSLVGVAWADGGLNMPDFRAAERTFQLIAQVTGRAGRGERPGRVIVQTMQPDHYSIVFARQHQYEQLYEHELKIRKMPLFPPFVRLIAVLIQGENEAQVKETAVSVAACCRQTITRIGLHRNGQGAPPPEVLGPSPSPLDRLRDQYRWQVLLKGRQVDELHRVCSEMVEKARSLAAGATRITVDVDPENMM